MNRIVEGLVILAGLMVLIMTVLIMYKELTQEKKVVCVVETRNQHGEYINYVGKGKVWE